VPEVSSPLASIALYWKFGMGLLGRVYVYDVTGMIYYKKSVDGDDYFT
jgi:hypothetical protein